MRFPLSMCSTPPFRIALLASALAIAAFSAPAFAQSSAPVAETEEATTLKIDPPQPQWAYIRGPFDSGGTNIFDGVTGKMRGMVSTSSSSDLAIDPAGKFYYVAETIWSKGYRGKRQDMVSVYDTTELKLQTEIPIPGRLIIGAQKQNFIVSDDGKLGFVYDLNPASSVNVVDLVNRGFVQNIELPGCAALMPNPGVGFSALCSDGSMATVAIAGKKATITHSAPFFSATDDPIFDSFTYGPAAGEVTMVSYTGKVYQAKLGAKPEIAAPWSLQAAAGVRAGDTKPLDLNWLPGGYQPTGLNRKTGHMYVLMHMGEYWTHKAAGTEIWDVDLAAKKVVKRFPLENHAINIEVTQTDEPLIFVNDEENTTYVIDGKTGEVKHTLKNAGSGIIATYLPK